ncbi:MAG: hypothetical protein ACRD1F_03775, partial [Terriglobales bacterium]
AWAAAGAGAAAAVVFAARRPTGSRRGRELLLRCAITIEAPAERIYELWRDPETQARLRKAVVRPLGEGSANWHWRRAFSNGGAIEGEIHLTREQPPERIEWTTENLQIHFRPGLPVRHVQAAPRGLLQLRPHPRRPQEPETTPEATEVRLRFGVAGAPPLPWLRTRILAGMRSSLRRLRALAETGALPTTSGQPAGERTRKGRLLLRTLEGPQPQPERKAS